jgi:cobyrinic acid a,c-diamide synthase
MIKKMGLFAALASVMCGPVCAQSCTITSVQASAKVRELQSVLMVGALQCRAVPGSTVIADYNRFIAAHKMALQNHNNALRAHFVHASGKTGLSDFDTFTTRLANANALAASSAGFCTMIGQLVQTAADTPSEQLPDFAAQMLPESAACLKD